MSSHVDRGEFILLTGRTAVVTGGSRGIGFQIAKIFIEQGARVLAVSRSSEKLAGAKTALPSLETIAADAADPDQIDTVVSWVRDRWGSLDILVNNAGVMETDDADLTAGDDSVFVDTVHTNLFGPYFCTKRFLPLLLEAADPRVINVGSRSGILTPNLRSAYGVSKVGLHGLTIATAGELEGRVAVNALSPGHVLTDLAPDGPGDPRSSAEAALEMVTMPSNIVGKLFHATPAEGDRPAVAVERAWGEF
jgi:NAD(P)-dependent dehydrogenase (short-subunit alcohol dehydrogenase family)